MSSNPNIPQPNISSAPSAALPATAPQPDSSSHPDNVQPQSPDSSPESLDGPIESLLAVPISILKPDYTISTLKPKYTLLTSFPVDMPAYIRKVPDYVQSHQTIDAEVERTHEYVIAFAGEVEPAGRLNDIFDLVRPTEAGREQADALLGYWLRCINQRQATLDQMPDIHQANKHRQSPAYYVVSRGVAAMAILKHFAWVDQLLIPAQEVKDDCGDILGYLSFMPAKYLQ